LLVTGIYIELDEDASRHGPLKRRKESSYLKRKLSFYPTTGTKILESLNNEREKIFKKKRRELNLIVPEGGGNRLSWERGFFVYPGRG